MESGNIFVRVPSTARPLLAGRIFSVLAAGQLKTFFPFFQTPDNEPFFTFSYHPNARAT